MLFVNKRKQRSAWREGFILVGCTVCIFCTMRNENKMHANNGSSGENRNFKNFPTPSANTGL